MEKEPNQVYKDSVINNCQDLLPEWLDFKTRVERSPGDRQLEGKYAKVYKKMDRYLQQLFAINVVVGEGDVAVT